MKFSNFKLYEWLKRVVASCENQAQTNTCERLLFLATDKGLKHIYFEELREQLFNKEMEFAGLSLDTTFDKLKESVDRQVKKSIKVIAKVCKDGGLISLAKEILDDVEKYGEE